jgi:hypothetical protein
MRSVDQIFFVKDTFGQSAEKARHSIFEYFAPRTEQGRFGVERATKRDKMGFVASSAM